MLPYQLIGVPTIINCEYKWSFIKLRHLIWQQIARFLINETATFDQYGPEGLLLRHMSEEIKHAENSYNVKKQLDFCKLLPLRITTVHGEALSNFNFPYKKDSMSGTSTINSSLSPEIIKYFDMTKDHTFDRVLGPPVPNMSDKDMTLGMHIYLYMCIYVFTSVSRLD